MEMQCNRWTKYGKDRTYINAIARNAYGIIVKTYKVGYIDNIDGEFVAANLRRIIMYSVSLSNKDCILTVQAASRLQKKQCNGRLAAADVTWRRSKMTTQTAHFGRFRFRMDRSKPMMDGIGST